MAILKQISDNVVMSATNPAQVSRANTALQELVPQLRNSAALLPSPFSDHLRAAVGEFEGNVASSTAGQLQLALRDQAYAVCQQTITNRYPFTRGSDRDVPLADFAKVFSPNGVLDGFFNQHLKRHADTSRAEWVWCRRPISSLLSNETLKAFQ